MKQLARELFKLKCTEIKYTQKVSPSFAQATFQMPESHMWLVTTTLDRAESSPGQLWPSPSRLHLCWWAWKEGEELRCSRSDGGDITPVIAG